MPARPLRAYGALTRFKYGASAHGSIVVLRATSTQGGQHGSSNTQDKAVLWTRCVKPQNAPLFDKIFLVPGGCHPDGRGVLPWLLLRVLSKSSRRRRRNSGLRRHSRCTKSTSLDTKTSGAESMCNNLLEEWESCMQSWYINMGSSGHPFSRLLLLLLQDSEPWAFVSGMAATEQRFVFRVCVCVQAFVAS